MKNTFGNAVSMTIFGESHGPAVGAVLDGLAAGLPVDEAAIAAAMDRRRARRDGLSTARTEADAVEFLSGVYQGHTTGTAVTMVVRNQNTRSSDYAKTADLLRPPATPTTRPMLSMKAFRTHGAAGTSRAASRRPASRRARSARPC